MRFLTARWEHLIFANYVIDPQILTPFVPNGTRIDTFQEKCFVSLVAFLFNDTRVLRFHVPYHVCFEEVNLRFYVTPTDDHSRRGVVFIKEIVPKKIIPWIANTLFRENYVAHPMTHQYSASLVEYSWDPPQKQSFSVTTKPQLTIPEPNSLNEFITEHYWGYAKFGSSTLEYQVEHPQWPCCDIADYKLDVNFAANYGNSFEVLNHHPPFNVQYAVGSGVNVRFPKQLRISNSNH